MALALYPVDEFFGQAGLADAGFAPDDDTLRLALLGVTPRLLELTPLRSGVRSGAASEPHVVHPVLFYRVVVVQQLRMELYGGG